MSKFLKRISIFAILALVIQLTLPDGSLANTNTNELETIQQKWNIDSEELEQLYNFVDNNNEAFLEYIDEDILNSSDFEDENAAIINQVLSSEQRSLNATGEIQPRFGILVRFYISHAIKKKMGDKIEDKIGKEVAERVTPKFQDAAEKAGKNHKYDSNKGPESSSQANGINQNEHIISLQDENGNDYLRFHVYLNPARNMSRWHWHTSDDWDDHKGNIDIYHESLPKWGSSK